MNKNSIVSLLILFIYTFYSCSEKPLYFENAYVIENINVIDPLEGLSEQMTLVIKENKISHLFKSKEIKLSTENTIYNGTDQFLIPGLWDAHIHFAFETILAEAMPNLFLSYGVTSVRDTGGPIEFVLPFKTHSLAHPKTTPRIMIAGPLVDGRYNVYDGSSDSFPLLSIQNASLTVLEQQVQGLIDKKVDFLKAYEMLSTEQFKRLAQMAQENDLKLTGHVPLSLDVISASNLGLNSMEHLRNIELSMSKDFDVLLTERTLALKNSNNSSGSKLRTSLHQSQRMRAVASIDPERREEVLNTLATNETWQIPTMELYQTFANKKYLNEEFQYHFKVLPENVRSKWMKKINVTSIDLDPESLKYTDWSQKMVQQMHEKKIPFMAGTDTPIGYLVPGLSLHDELIQLKRSGFSNLETLKAATFNPALYFGMEDTLGRIKPGYEADLVLLEKNPLESIENSRTIKAVIKSGKFMNRSYLDSLQVN
ncbi:amidohydrolase family protein [Flavobacteriaceae bacterium]|nr:amidohydrolase family protein [Flavobacteriaceae bacterium]